MFPTLGICVSRKGEYRTSDVCFSGKGTRITSGMFFSSRGKHITRNCSRVGKTHFPLECVLKGKHITSDMCFRIGETHIMYHLEQFLAICVPLLGIHIPLAKCVPYLGKQEGNLRAHACIRWKTTVWVHQIWWREIENSRIVTVFLKDISLGLWILYFPTKNVLRQENRTFSTLVSVVEFSAVVFLDLIKTLKTQHQKSLGSCIRLIFIGKAMHFYVLISQLMALLIKEEMHRSNVQLLKKSEKIFYYSRFLY